jgi:hypothetical protein
MRSLRQILSDRAVTEIILLRAPRTATPFNSEELDATVHESHDTLAALANICILKQRQRPKNGYPRESRPQMALIYCKRSDADDIPMMDRMLKHLRKAHRDVGIWCLAEDGVFIETNAPIQSEKPSAEAQPQKPSFSDQPSERNESAYGSLKFRGSFVEDAAEPEIDQGPEQPIPQDLDLETSDNFEDPDSTEARTDPTVSPEEMEMLFHDSDEDHEDGQAESDTTEDPVR